MFDRFQAEAPKTEKVTTKKIEKKTEKTSKQQPGDGSVATEVSPSDLVVGSTVIKSQSKVLIFDVETTGIDKKKDQVIELCLQWGVEDDAKQQVWRIKPSVPIHPEAKAVHGIGIEDLEDCPSFGELAEDLRVIFDDCNVWVGYNIEFDIGMMQAEYSRLQSPLLNMSGKSIVDAFRLWQRCEQRTLQDAHRRFVGKGFDAAHSAAADVRATGNVLTGMMRDFQLADKNWQEISLVCFPEQASWVGPSRHICWSDAGEPVMGFGKHAGAPLHELAKSDNRNYLRWIIGSDFPPHVQQICSQAFAMPAQEFLSWVSQEYPRPMSADSV